jgi:hypothetical protein
MGSDLAKHGNPAPVYEGKHTDQENLKKTEERACYKENKIT